MKKQIFKALIYGLSVFFFMNGIRRFQIYRSLDTFTTDNEFSYILISSLLVIVGLIGIIHFWFSKKAS